MSVWEAVPSGDCWPIGAQRLLPHWGSQSEHGGSSHIGEVHRSTAALPTLGKSIGARRLLPHWGSQSEHGGSSQTLPHERGKLTGLESEAKAFSLSLRHRAEQDSRLVGIACTKPHDSWCFLVVVDERQQFAPLRLPAP